MPDPYYGGSEGFEKVGPFRAFGVFLQMVASSDGDKEAVQRGHSCLRISETFLQILLISGLIRLRC